MRKTAARLAWDRKPKLKTERRSKEVRDQKPTTSFDLRVSAFICGKILP
jgi:hypothetical protein